MPEDFRRAHPQLNQLLEDVRGCALATQPSDSPAAQQLTALLRQVGRHVETDWKKAQEAINFLVRTQTAQGLAPQFLQRKKPYEDQPQLDTLLQEGLLDHAAFLQKPPHILSFYRWLLGALERQPRGVLEIGVKGGGSTALWKAVFPASTVVGLDVKLRVGLTEPSDDGVIYVEGDQTDVTLLKHIADTHGPFGLVIDDGSHVAEHQAVTLASLLPRVEPGGYYVIEDIHTAVKQAGTRAGGYGDDVWADFTLAVLQRLRRGPLPVATTGSRLGLKLAKWIDDLVIARQVLAIRARARESD